MEETAEKPMKISDDQPMKFDELSVRCRMTYLVRLRLMPHVSIIRRVSEPSSEKKLRVGRIK